MPIPMQQIHRQETLLLLLTRLLLQRMEPSIDVEACVKAASLGYAAIGDDPVIATNAPVDGTPAVFAGNDGGGEDASG